MLIGWTAVASAVVLYVMDGGRWTLGLLALVVYYTAERSERLLQGESAPLLEQRLPRRPAAPVRAASTPRDLSVKPDPSCKGMCIPPSVPGAVRDPNATVTERKGGCCGGKGKKSGSCCGGKGSCCSTRDDMEIDFTNAFKDGLETTPVPLKRKVVRAGKKLDTASAASAAPAAPPTPLLETNYTILYSSLTGLARRAAETVARHLGLASVATKLLSLDTDVDDLEEHFATRVTTPTAYILVLPLYDTDLPIDYLLETLLEILQDFRIDKYPLSLLQGFAVLGLGDLELYPDVFCLQAKEADHLLARLGGKRLFPLGQVCMKRQGDSGFDLWAELLVETLLDDNFVYQENLDDELELENDSTDTLVDVEDMGRVMKSEASTTARKEMVAKDSPTFKSLTKQGYTIVGSHLGVKICRWTKLALRGRGLCYKYAFYGIELHLCMETTPLLACSNKCVFCWRHGTNPVARDKWRWEVDLAQDVFDGAKAGHYAKIKQLRGVPGVKMDRFQEAFQIRHCALLLVGEPIFYPHISEFVGLLHAERILSFLVCNAQHPAQLAALGRVTQLYVLIDAPTRDTLKSVDRPLNRDFWERLNLCLDIVRTSQSHQRTVYRLTLVKGFNMADVEEYALLIERGRPLQVEVKGATFCGSLAGNGNPLTMQNIPFYAECQLFVEELAACLQRRGLPYEVAAEHAHSCCILIADTKFKVEGRWHTHIDYQRFFELVEAGAEFRDVDYMKETPEWAWYGNGGFRPDDVKWDRKGEKEKRRAEREAAALATPSQ